MKNVLFLVCKFCTPCSSARLSPYYWPYHRHQCALHMYTVHTTYIHNTHGNRRSDWRLYRIDQLDTCIWQPTQPNGDTIAHTCICMVYSYIRHTCIIHMFHSDYTHIVASVPFCSSNCRQASLTAWMKEKKKTSYMLCVCVYRTTLIRFIQRQ